MLDTFPELFAKCLVQTFRLSSEATDRATWTWGPSSHPTRLSAACSASCSLERNDYRARRASRRSLGNPILYTQHLRGLSSITHSGRTGGSVPVPGRKG